MKASLRTFVVAIAAIAVGGCGNEDKTVATPSVDVLAQDTTLQLTPPLRPDQDLGPQDIMAVAAPASGTAVEAAPARKQSADKASRRAATRNTSLASGTRNSVSSRMASQRVRATRRATVASATSSRIETRSRAARRQARSTGRVPGRDVGVGETGSRVAAANEPATPTTALTNRAGVVAAGSELDLQAERRVCTNTASVGDRFEAVLVNQVPGANGTVIPKGATAVALVSSIQRDQVQSGGGIDIQIESISFNGRTYPVSSRVTDTQLDKVRSGSRGGDLAKVAAGAVLGAGAGQVVGRDTRSTVIGAAGGAAAGAVLAGRSSTVNACVPNGGRIIAELVQPLTIQAAE